MATLSQPLAHKPVVPMHGGNNITKRQPADLTDNLRPKRAKTTKACNACRKQKSRCERLAGDLEGCHRCGVIGIPCIFDSEGSSTHVERTKKPRAILPRSLSVEEQKAPRIMPLENSGLHVLANTTEMLSRESRSYAHTIHVTNRQPSPSRAGPSIRTSLPKQPLSSETLSTVESALFPPPRDHTSESEAARFRADWRRWMAPLTLLQTLVRRNNAHSSIPSEDANWQVDRSFEVGLLTVAEQKLFKDHFRIRFSPWLPAVRLGKDGTLDDISPFLSTVIYATVARSLGEVPPKTIGCLRAQSLHYVGQVFANPATFPLVESLYALLILVLWPLDAADDVALLVHGAKRLASGQRDVVIVRDPDSQFSGGHSERNLDHTRLWYAICANETILTLGAGNISTLPEVDELVQAFGSASELALSGGCVSDVLLVMQTNLHRIVIAAMGERGLPSDKNATFIPKGRASVQSYITAVQVFFTRLGEWEIEFYTISAECHSSEATYYAVLEMEYHYLCLMYATHCLLTLCHACPLTSASDEIKYALWSWSVTGNKSAHALIRLFNTYSRPRLDQHVPTGEDGLHVPLGLAPDRIYAMVVLAVMLILRHQVASYEYGRRRGLAESPPAGFTKQAENAIRNAVDRMGHIGHAKNADGKQHTLYDHAASRYVDILEALLRIWFEKRAQKVASVAAPNDYVEDECEYEHQKVGECTALPLPHDQLHDEGAMHLSLDLSLLGGDLFSDAAATLTWDGLGTLDWSSVAQ